MKKILLIVSVALLIGAMLVVSCSAVTYQFKVDEILLGFTDLTTNYDDSENVVTYLIDGDLIDGVTGAHITKVIVRNSAVDSSWVTELYTETGLYNYLEPPDLMSYGLVVTAEGDVDYETAVDYFEFAFQLQGRYISKVNIMDSLFPNIGKVLSWIPSVFVMLAAVFWTGSALTPLGYLAIAGLSISVILLIVFLISRFLKFRG